MSADELEIMILRHRLEDIQKRIAVGDFEINDPDLRPPSPNSGFDPVTGQKISNREIKGRDKYINEKNFIIETLIKLDRKFVAPADYKPPIKRRKIFLPDADLGDTNYIGLIIGPGGKTQKDLEKRSKCKIAIRGQGASMKSRIYNKKENDENEPLHISVESINEEDLEVGVRLVNELLDPNSDHKKNQLIEIAAIRGTLRDDWCEDCGEKGHRRFECPNKVNSWKKVEIRCEICGQTTHPSRDCPMKNASYYDGISAEDDLNDFLEELKSQKNKAIEDSKKEEDTVEAIKDNAYDDAAKKVVNAIEKESPGAVSKEVKDIVKPYQKRDGEQLNDRVVALRNVENKMVVAGSGDSGEERNPLNDLHNRFKDTYGKLLANEAVNFYTNIVQPNAQKPPQQPNYPHPPYPNHQPPYPNHQAPYPNHPPNQQYPPYQGPPRQMPPMQRPPYPPQYPGYPPYQNYGPPGPAGPPGYPYPPQQHPQHPQHPNNMQNPPHGQMPPNPPPHGQYPPQGQNSKPS